jgi:capsular polysaccharide transport system ATP-binding protein
MALLSFRKEDYFTMIKLENVTKYFYTKNSKKYILQNVTLELPDENIGILGRNGAGKSTLMRMLGGIEFPNSGKIISDKTFSWPLGLGGGFVGNMSGRANIKFVCNLFGKSKQQTNQIIEFVYDFSELGNYFDMPIKTYSSGMKGRLGFGLSLAFDFDYMIIDETLSVGDARFRKKAKEALKKKIENCNVILVSHDMKTLQEMCQVGLLVNNGQLTYYEDIQEGIDEYTQINKTKGK